MQNSATRKIAICAILLAADILLTRVLALNTAVMKIGLGFLAVALCAALYGPWWGALVAALGDLLGSLVFLTGAYFPGFTLTAALTGIIFGLCFWKKPFSAWRAVLAAALNVILISYFANSAMIAYIGGSPYVQLLKIRAIQLAIMLPVQALVLTLIFPAILKKIS